MVMKLIITESQYNELNKLDDIYDDLDPYYRRRINYIDIKDNIDMRIGYRTAKALKHDSRNLVGHMNNIIHHVLWSTIPDEWGGSDDRKLHVYADIMFNKLKEKYGKYIIDKLNKILKGEDNNN